MEHLNRLTAQQLAIAAASASLAAAGLLAQGARIGYLPLAVAALCTVGALARYLRR